MSKKQYKKTVPVPPVAVPKSKKEPAPSTLPFIDKLRGKETYVLFFLLLLISFFVFKDYLFYNKIYLFKDIGSDSINIFYPFYVHNARYVHDVGLPQWSFHVGMGQCVLPFSVGDPFNNFLYFLFSNETAKGIIWNELLKMILGGLFFYLYLKAANTGRLTALIGGLLYAFNGYMSLGSSGWYGVTTEAVWAPLLLFAFEKYLREGIWYYVPISWGIMLALQPFFLYPYGLLIAIYSVVRYLDEGKSISWKSISSFYLRYAGFAILGIGIAGLFFITNLYQLLQSPRVSGDATYFNALQSKPIFETTDKMQSLSIVSRLFSNDLIGVGSQFKGWMNYLESPILYAGIITLLLVPQLYFFLNKRKKIIFGTLALVGIIPLIFPYFRYLFWGFAGDYYRSLSFFIILLLLFLGLRAFSFIDRLKKVNYIILGATLILLLFALYSSDPIKNQVIVKDLRSSITAFILLYAALIALMGNQRTAVYAKIGVVFLLVIELTYLTRITTGKRDVITREEFEQKVGYNDYTKDAVAYLNKIDKSFYRTNKDYSSGPSIHTSMNDAMVQGYYGSMSYSSFNQKYYIEFLQGMNIIQKGNETATRWAMGVSNRPLLQPLVSYKYFLSTNKNNQLQFNGFDSIHTFGNVRVFRNKYYLPFGFTYDKVIPSKDFRRLSDMRKDLALYNSFVPDSADISTFQDFGSYSLADTSKAVTWDTLAASIRKLKEDSLHITAFEQNRIKGDIAPKRKKLLFLSMPYDMGWKAFIDGKEEKILKVDYGLAGLIIPPGKHEVEFKYKSVYLQEGIFLSLCSIGIFGVLLWFFRKKRWIVN